MKSSMSKKQIPGPISGIKKRFANVPTLTFANATYATADLVALFQSVLDTTAATAPLKAQWQQSVQVARDTAGKVGPILRAFKAYVRALFAGNAEALTDFGMSASTPRTPTVAAKAKAVAERSATRAARRTMGKRQRQAIKGTLPATPPPASPTKPNAS